MKKQQVNHVFNEFANQSTISGLDHLVNASTIFSKLLWIGVIVLATIYTGFRTIRCVEEYFNYPVDVMIKLSIDPVTFPAITFCSLNQFSKERLRKSNTPIGNIIGAFGNYSYKEMPKTTVQHPRKKRNRQNNKNVMTRIKRNIANNIPTKSLNVLNQYNYNNVTLMEPTIQKEFTKLGSVAIVGVLPNETDSFARTITVAPVLMASKPDDANVTPGLIPNKIIPVLNQVNNFVTEKTTSFFLNAEIIATMAATNKTNTTSNGSNSIFNKLQNGAIDLSNFLNTALNNSGSVINQIANETSNVINTILNETGSVVQLSNETDSVLQQLANKTVSVLQQLANETGSVINGTNSLLNIIVNGSAFSQILNETGSVANQILNGTNGLVSSVLNNTGSTLDQILNETKNALNKVLNETDSVGGVKNIFNDTVNVVKGMVDGILSKNLTLEPLVNLLSQTLNAVVNIVSQDLLQTLVLPFLKDITQDLYQGLVLPIYNLHKNADPLNILSQTQDDMLYAAGQMPEDQLIALGYNLTDVMAYCSFNETVCKDSDFRTKYFPMAGNCFTYNYKPPYKTVARPGQINGLKLYLVINESDYSDTANSAGFRVLIHNQFDAIFPDSEGFYLSPSADTSVSLIKYSTKRLSSPYGNCINNADQNPYSVEMCFRLCQQKIVVKKCNCSDPSLPPYPGTRNCTLVKKVCVDSVKNSTSYQNSTEACNCLPLCQNTYFTKTFSKARLVTNSYLLERMRRKLTIASKFDSTDLFKSHHISNRSAASELVKLNVYFDTISYNSLLEYPAYDMPQVLSDIGNWFGLFLGFSFITFFEVVSLVSNMFSELVFKK